MGRSNPWGDLDQMWLVGRYGGRNHVCNIWWLSVKVCGCSERGNFALSHRLAVSPLQHWSHYRVIVWSIHCLVFDVYSVKRMYNVKVSTGKNTWCSLKVNRMMMMMTTTMCNSGCSNYLSTHASPLLFQLQYMSKHTTPLLFQLCVKTYHCVLRGRVV